MKKIFQIVVCVLLCQSAGLIGSFFTASTIPTWYAGLEKPFFNPPNWLFAPAWLTLYIIMGVSLYLVWQRRKDSPQSKKALILFGAQLGLNALWSIIFFGLKK